MIDDFITGEKFYAVADFLFNVDCAEPTKIFDGSNLPNHTVIVYTHATHIDELLYKICNLPRRFVIVTHNSDCNVYDATKLPNNVVHWFSQNVCVLDPRLSSIPIGLENSRWFPETRKKEKMLRKTGTPKTFRNLVYVNHDISTNPTDRSPAYRVLGGKPFATTVHGRNPFNFDAYLDDLYHHKFIVSPPGNGVDTHRKWEALYVGTIPIEKKCPNNTFYTDLPICLIDDWDQLTERFLDAEYARIRATAWNLDKLRMSYWLELIAGARH